MLRTYKAQYGEWTYNIEGEFYHLYDNGFFPAPSGTDIFVESII